MALFHKNKLLCIIPSLENEPHEHYIDRCNFIMSQPINNDNEYNKILTYSYIYSNNKYLGCTYDSQTTLHLNKMVDKSYTQ